MADQDEVLLQTRLFRVVRRWQEVDGRERPREIVEHPGAVLILPLLDDGKVCLIRNYRVAVDEELIELPAGTLEPGEEPHRTAERELSEETGYTAGRLDPAYIFYMSPGILTEQMHLFVARDLKPGPFSLEPGEEIAPLVVAWDEALRLVRDHEIRDAKTIAALLWFDRFGKF